MQSPVAKRSTRAGVRLSTHSARAAFSAAPASALHSMRMRGDTISGRLPSAEAKVPTMKPACTAMVSPARPPSPSCHSRESAGSTAAALNHRDSAPTSARERKARARQRPGAGSATLLGHVVATRLEAGVVRALSVVEVLVVEIRSAERGAEAPSRDGAHGRARAHDAAGHSRRGPQPGPRRSAHEEAHQGALGQRLVGVVAGLLLRLEIAVELVIVH